MNLSVCVNLDREVGFEQPISGVGRWQGVSGCPAIAYELGPPIENLLGSSATLL